MICHIRLFQNACPPRRPLHTDWLLLLEIVHCSGSESKHKYKGSSVSKMKVSTLGQSSNKTNVIFPRAGLRAWISCTPLLSENKSSHPAQKQRELGGEGWASQGLSRYWAACWHSHQGEQGIIQQISKIALWKSNTGTSKIDLSTSSIHITYIPVNDSIFTH